MLIVCQDKKKIVNMDLVTDISIYPRDGKFKIMACYPGDDACNYIGDYSTESKAIQVLDIIQDVYRGAVHCPTGFNKNVVLHMPSDEDVIV